MTQIYANTRQRIVNKFLEYSFSDKEKLLETEEHILAFSIFKIRYGEYEKSLVHTLPDSWFPKITYFHVNAGGYSDYINFGKEIKAPYEACRRIDITDRNLITLIQNHFHKRMDLKKEKNTLRSKVTSFLTNVRTKKKLLEMMPQAEEILGKEFFNEITPCALVPYAEDIITQMKKIKEAA